MAKKHSLMRCRECGFPRFVSFFVRWNDNGTITQFMRRDFRLVIMHFGFIDNLFANIEARLGLSIEHIAFEAQRNASKAVFEAAYNRVPGAKFMVQRFNFLKPMGVELFNKVAVITGMCLSKSLDYVPGKYGVARMRNPFNLNLMAANVVGAFEALEGIPFNHTWEEESKDTYLIRVESTGEKPEIAERMKLEYPRLLPGNLKHDRCTRCKTPRALSYLKWMENDGTILDSRTGARVVINDGYMVTTVFREMVRELGEEINEMLVEAQREWTVDHVEQLGLARGNGPISREELEKAYREYLGMLPLYGQGNPVDFEFGDSGIELVVENPYEPNILAGTLQGLYEALQKGKSTVTWEKVREGTVSYRVAPAGQEGGP